MEQGWICSVETNLRGQSEAHGPAGIQRSGSSGSTKQITPVPLA